MALDEETEARVARIVAADDIDDEKQMMLFETTLWASLAMLDRAPLIQSSGETR